METNPAGGFEIRVEGFWRAASKALDQSSNVEGAVGQAVIVVSATSLGAMVSARSNATQDDSSASRCSWWKESQIMDPSPLTVNTRLKPDGARGHVALALSRPWSACSSANMISRAAAAVTDPSKTMEALTTSSLGGSCTATFFRPSWTSISIILWRIKTLPSVRDCGPPIPAEPPRGENMSRGNGIAPTGEHRPRSPPTSPVFGPCRFGGGLSSVAASRTENGTQWRGSMSGWFPATCCSNIASCLEMMIVYLLGGSSMRRLVHLNRCSATQIPAPTFTAIRTRSKGSSDADSM
mmetsp:Transcript_70526/g.187869  ORF Transcript_70526/g.187869 Transcript_70526/m.187869 type:complete len:295 (-) Transcript_70526:763-1647(-)